MDECNDSIPEERQGKIRAVMYWLRATAVSGWGCGTYLLHGVQAQQRRILVFLYRYWLPLLGGLPLLLAIGIQHAIPQWPVYVVPYLQENLLVIGTAVLLLLFLFLWKIPEWQVASIADEKDRLATESGFRQTLVQLVGGVALLGGLYFTVQTLRISQDTLRVNLQGQITERFTSAIEQLGNKERLMVRLGGIYALEQVARDSESYHGAVMEVLTAFVREAPAKTSQPDKSSEKRKTPKDRLLEWELPVDIQAILTVIGRRTRTFQNGEYQRLYLRYANLQGAHLERAQLQGAILEDAQLQGAFLWLAQLQNAHLERAQLRNAFLVDAELQDADLEGAELQGADLEGAELLRVELRNANLTTARNLTQDQINKACVNENTKLPAGLRKPARPAPCPPNP